jgi:hypothetical protein
MSDIPTEKLLPQGLQDMLSAHRKYTSQANDINNEIIDREMKTLHLPLKAKWYEMIESGEKTEEYREIKPYWEKRLLKYGDVWGSRKDVIRINKKSMLLFRHYDVVKFSYGYTKRTMTFEIESITIGKGKSEWGAPTEDVFIIKLGKRV